MFSLFRHEMYLSSYVCWGGGVRGVVNRCVLVISFLAYLTTLSHLHDYELDDRMIGVRIPTGDGNFFLHPCVQTGSGAHTASYEMGTGGVFPCQ